MQEADKPHSFNTINLTAYLRSHIFRTQIIYFDGIVRIFLYLRLLPTCNTSAVQRGGRGNITVVCLGITVKNGANSNDKNPFRCNLFSLTPDFVVHSLRAD